MKKHPDICSYIKEHPEDRPAVIAKATGYSESHIRKLRGELGLPSFKKEAPLVNVPVSEQVTFELKEKKLKQDKTVTEKKNRELASRLEKLERELGVAQTIKEVTVTKIPKGKVRASHATAVVLASDWHIEETVDPHTVSGLNEFNLEIAQSRSEEFFRSVVALITAKQKAIKVDTLVLALLGDFITNNIHDELMEGNSLLPADALLFVQNLLASGIQHILDNTNVDIILPCHTGNHGRMTQHQRIATEKGNSIEVLMYHMLADKFRTNKRVEFRIAEGYFSYVQIADFTIRMHHGHHLRYQGGVGGLYIPVNKAIAQWNKGRAVDLDCFGHFHQLKWSGNKGFVCNGSLIGYGPYAMSIKADFEKPQQAFFLVNHERSEVTDVSPVWVD